MGRPAKLREKNGHWYSEAGGRGRYYGRVGEVSHAEAVRRFRAALAGRDDSEGPSARPAARKPEMPARPPETGGPAIRPPTLARLASRFLRWVRDQRGEKAHRERSRHIRRFREVVGPILATEATGGDLERFEADLRAKKFKPDYIQKHRISVIAMFHWGSRKGHLPAGFKPFAGVDPIRKSPKALTESDLVTDAEIAALLEHADATLGDLIRLYHATGARTHELLAARVGDVQPRTRQIVLGGHKRSHTLRVPRPRSITLNADAWAIVARRCEGRSPSDHLFVNRNRRPFPTDAFNLRFRRLREKAGTRDSITPYSFRHLWISEALMAGLDVFLVAKMAGTSVLMIESTYGHFRMQSFAEAQARLDAMRSGRIV